MRALLCAVFICAARAAEISIDSGSVTDTFYSGGAAYSITEPLPAGVDATLRFGSSFSYVIPAYDIPWLVTFRFIEPTVTGPGQRVFSVRINNQVVIDHIDLWAEAGYLKPVTRSVIVAGSDGALRIRFEAHTRSAVVSAIECNQLLAKFAQILPVQ